MSYDPKCHEIAEHFLQDVPHHTAGDVAQLAQAIQDAIENEIHEIELKVATGVRS